MADAGGAGALPAERMVTEVTLRHHIGAAINGVLGLGGLRLVRRSDDEAPTHEVFEPAVMLSGDGVVLRRFAAIDGPSLRLAHDDPEIAGQALLNSQRTYPDIERWLELQADRRVAGHEISFAICESGGADGPCVGQLSLYDVDWANRRAAVAYWLLPAARGRGLMTASLERLAGWAFDEVGLERLETMALAHNAPSLAVAKRCGFRREGRMRAWLITGDDRQDMIVLARLATDAAAVRRSA